jgi:hypothetical protein
VGITTKRSGTPVKFDAEKAAKVIGAFVPGAILRRTDQGISSTGQAFASYSQSYRERLASMSEDQKIDLRLTGGLMNSIKVRDKRITSQGVEVVIAPDTGASPQVSPRNGKAHRTGKQGPAHNVLGYWIHHGTSTTPARPFMGLTPEQERELNVLLGKAKVFG